MNCAEFKKSLSLLARDELEPAARAQSESHAAQCPACGRELAEIIALEKAVAAAAAADGAWADARLEGFEERMAEHRRREATAKAMHGQPASSRPRRFAFGLSLAFNLVAAACLLILFLSPKPGQPGRTAAVRALPAGLPTQQQMQYVYGELEALFGERLSWVSQSGGQLAMGIIHGPESPAAAGDGGGPLMALIYWTDDAGNPAVNGQPEPVVIMTRAGRPIRERIPVAGRRSSLEIAVNSLKERRDGFAVQTELSAGDTGQVGGASSLATSLSLAPGRPAKLGELRVGDRYYDAWVAVQMLGERSGHEDKS